MQRIYIRFRNFFIGEILTESEDIIAYSQIEIAFNLILLSIISTSIQIPYLIYYRQWALASLTALLGIAFVFAFILLFRNKSFINPVRIMLICVLLLSVTYAFYYEGQLPLIDGIYYTIYIYIAFNIAGIKWGQAVSFFIVAFVILIAVNNQEGWHLFNVGINDKPNLESNPVGILIAFAILIYIINYSVKIKISSQATLKTQYQLLRYKNVMITESIHYAERIQKSILPDPQLLNDTFSDSFVLYMPKDIVSGDFYWIYEKTDTIFFGVVDCTGHGVPGAMMSFIGESGLQRAVTDDKLTNPADILNSLNSYVEKFFSRDESSDGMDIALCAYNKLENKLLFSGANSPIYVLRNNALKEYKAQKQPIGRYFKREPYQNLTINIKKGDCIYMFSDGYADQFGGPHGKKFKYKPFKNLLLKINQEPMNLQLAILNETIGRWKKDYEQVDDICVMGVRL